MRNNVLKSVKRNHLLQIMKDIYIHENVTMNELIQRTQLSQPSVRNMIRLLQEKKEIVEAGNDLSSGGRCAIRFAVNKDGYNILCLYVHDHIINYQIRCFNKLVKEGQYEYLDQNELKNRVTNLISSNLLNCCVISVDGIVIGDDKYIIDHHNVIEKQLWLHDIKKTISLPVYLENDVKTMHLGSYFHHQKEHTFYLHINKVGVGSSYFNQNRPMYGASGLMGEIGLIPLDGIMVNQRIRECKSQLEFNEIIVFILSLIFTMIDPNYMDISIDLKWEFDKEYVKDYFNRSFDLHFKGKMNINNNFKDLLFDGMMNIGIDNLMREKVGKL